MDCMAVDSWVVRSDSRHTITYGVHVGVGYVFDDLAADVLSAHVVVIRAVRVRAYPVQLHIGSVHIGVHGREHVIYRVCMCRRVL